MAEINTVILDESFALYVDLERLSNGAAKNALKLLKEMQKELIGKLGTADEWTATRIKQQLQESDAVINRYYRSIGEQSQSNAYSVAQASAQSTASALATATGQQFTAGLMPTVNTLEIIATDAMITGAPQRDWWVRQSASMAWQFKTQISQSIVNGETLTQAVARVRDIMQTQERNTKALVKTAIFTVANEAREATYEQNSDLIKGKEWLTALDYRPCPKCAIRDNKQWDLKGKPINGNNIPYSIPPLHINCRCTLVPVVKTPEELGINLPDLSPKERSSLTGATTDKTFPDWLRRQPEDKITEYLGKGRAELWLSGKITFEQMFDKGNPLTLDELKGKYKIN